MVFLPFNMRRGRAFLPEALHGADDFFIQTPPGRVDASVIAQRQKLTADRKPRAGLRAEAG